MFILWSISARSLPQSKVLKLPSSDGFFKVLTSSVAKASLLFQTLLAYKACGPRPVPQVQGAPPGPGSLRTLSFLSDRLVHTRTCLPVRPGLPLSAQRAEPAPRSLCRGLKWRSWTFRGNVSHMFCRNYLYKFYFTFHKVAMYVLI